MNLRLFSISFLISALPIVVPAEIGITLNNGDFRAAEKITQEGDQIINVKLSKSGKAKLRRLKEMTSDKKQIEVQNRSF